MFGFGTGEPWGGGIVAAAQAVVFWTLPTDGPGVARQPPQGYFGGGGCRRAVFNGELPNRASFLLPVG